MFTDIVKHQNYSFIHSFILKFHESPLVRTGLGCRTCQITICTVSTNAGK
jgi:hypothetical protein